MSSRKFLLYLDGLLATTDGWYAKVIRRDYAEIEAEQIAAEERLARAETKAQITGAPLEMSDL